MVVETKFLVAKYELRQLISSPAPYLHTNYTNTVLYSKYLVRNFFVCEFMKQKPRSVHPKILEKVQELCHLLSDVHQYQISSN